MQKILRWEGTGGLRQVEDELAPEEPLEIRLENKPVAVTMRTPGHEDELAAGFLFSEGIIRRREQVVKIAPYVRNVHRNVIGVFLSEAAGPEVGRLARRGFISSSCGLCGKTSIDAVRQRFPAIRSKARAAAAVLAGLPEAMRSSQAAFARTGGIHAAAIFSLDGQLMVLREDIGRHNAVDKVLGHALLNNLLPCDRHILAVSGRASFEIMQKALAGRFPIVAAVSAPSDLAVQFARAHGQTLVGFIRGPRFNVYSCPRRVGGTSPAHH